MKVHSEAILNIYSITELLGLLENQTDMKVNSIIDSNGDQNGLKWEQKDVIVTIIHAGKLDKEEQYLRGCDVGSKKDINDRSQKLFEKLFLPWELHTPVYIIVEYSDIQDIELDKISEEKKEAFLKGYARIIAEELMKSIGAWIPKNKALLFSMDTWEYEVEISKIKEVEHRDVSKLADRINMRAIGTDYYNNFL